MPDSNITAILREHWNFRLSEGVQLTLEHTPLDYSSSGAMKNGVIVLPDTKLDRVHVGYIVYDESPGDFWSEGEAGSYRQFSRNESPHEIMEEMEGQIPPPLPVQEYRHGNSHFSLAGTHGYPDRQWDVGASGVYTPPLDVYEKYISDIAKIGEDVAMEAYYKTCNGILDEYSNWANGQVYGAIVETWEILPDSQLPERVDSEPCWGLLGWESAEEYLRSEMAPPTPSGEAEGALPSPSP